MPYKQFHLESMNDLAEGVLALTQVIRLIAVADDSPNNASLTQQEKLCGVAEVVKQCQREGSFAHQLMQFVGSATQDDGKPKLSIV